MNTASDAMPPPPCRVCGSADTRVVGPIRHYQPATIGSVVIDLSGLSFGLVRCVACDYRFSHPPIPQEKLLDCYAETEGDHWGFEVDGRERQYDVMAAMLERHAPGRRVLDVGCFTGSLLQYLGPAWERFGVEPSRAACRVATERAGATILGATLDDVPAGLAGTFDAVTAIDVVEHVADPLPFFRRVRELLRPGGVFLVVTGDTAAPSWRWLKSRYWYCSYAGHISFFSRRTLARVGAIVGFAEAESRRRRHIRSRFLRHVKQAMQNVAYGASVAVGGLGIRSVRRRTVDAPAPVWITARDHLFHVMRRAD